jgi:hypothetical protein
VDFDDLTIVEYEHGRRFLEQSTMMTQKRWRHERIVERRDSGCRVIDRLHWHGRTAVHAEVFRLARCP